jgi:hypothetical protein
MEGKDVFSWRVRLLAGEGKGKLAYVPTIALARLRTRREIEREKAEPARPMRPGSRAHAFARQAPNTATRKKTQPKSAPPVGPSVVVTNESIVVTITTGNMSAAPGDLGVVAATLFRTAAQLEESGLIDVAANLYSEVVKLYPATMEAEMAWKRLEALRKAR